MPATVKWELWRRHRRDGKPDELLESGESDGTSYAYRAIRVAEMNYPIGWCPELNYVLVDGRNRKEGTNTPYPINEGVKNSGG